VAGYEKLAARQLFQTPALELAQHTRDSLARGAKLYRKRLMGRCDQTVLFHL
jgi:hypothetical protein